MGNHVYNFNALRPALIAAYQNGNTSAISEKFCKKLELPDYAFAAYNNLMGKLYNAVSDYVRVKFDKSKSDDEIKAVRNAIFPAWRALLECGEKDKFSKELHVREADIDSIVGYGETFMASTINYDLEKEFKSPKAQATAKLAYFRRDVETRIGITIHDTAVMTDEQRDINIIGRKLVNKKKALLGKVVIENDKIDLFKTEFMTASEDRQKELKLFTEASTALVAEYKAALEEIDGLIAKIKDGATAADIEALIKSLNEAKAKAGSASAKKPVVAEKPAEEVKAA